MNYKKKQEINLEVESEKDDNRFGAEIFTENDTDVLEELEKICWIFDTQNESNTGFLDLEEFKRYYILLEKGYRLSPYQKRRLQNAWFFAKKRHERFVDATMELHALCEKREKEEKDSSPFSAFSPEE